MARNLTASNRRRASLLRVAARHAFKRAAENLRSAVLGVGGDGIAMHG